MAAGDDDRHVGSPDAPSHSVSSVPAELDSFVGRSGLLENARTLLHGADTRLVTLTGFGGVGKTRLLLRLGHDLTASQQYRDGVVVASLADLREAGDRLYAAIADALDIHSSASAPTLDRLCDYLRDRRLLLLLDNCEHLVGDTPGVGPVPELLNLVLRQAPGLQVLATSRVRLGVQGERLLPVPPLCVSDEDDCDCAARDQDVHEALQLLIDRAAELGVTIPERDYAVAAQLCRRLDGIPLAIELAVEPLIGNAMTVRALKEHPDLLQLLDAVTSGHSSHHTLHATLSWSFARLLEPEQQMWMLASVFEGAFDVEAAVTVTVGHESGIAEADVQPLLVRLVSKNLLKAVERHGRPQYRMLATIREHGRQQAAASGVEIRLRQGHTTYFEDLAARASREWFGAREIQWMERLNDFQPDLIASQRRLLADPQTAGRGLELALRVSQTRAFVFRGHLNESRRMLADGLAQHPEAPSAHQVAALSLAVWTALIQGRHDLAEPLLNRAEVAAGALGVADTFGPLDVARGTRLWLVEPDRARARQALTFFRRAAQAFQADGARGDAWMARLFLVMSAAFLRCLDVARTESEALLVDAEAAGAKWCISWALWSCALVELLDDNPRKAATKVQRALELQREIGDAWGPAWSLWLIALIAAQLGEYVTAAQVLGGAGARQRSTQASVLGLLPFLRRQQQTETAGRHHLGDDEWDRHVEAGRNLSKDKMHALALGPLVEPVPETLPAGVSHREFQIAGLIARGWTNATIAGHLSLTPRTVSTHISNLNRKLGTTSRTGIAAWYLAFVASDAAGTKPQSP